MIPDERRRVGEETSPPSNSPWLKYVSVVQGVDSGFVKYSIFGHETEPLVAR